MKQDDSGPTDPTMPLDLLPYLKRDVRGTVYPPNGADKTAAKTAEDQQKIELWQKAYDWWLSHMSKGQLEIQQALMLHTTEVSARFSSYDPELHPNIAAWDAQHGTPRTPADVDAFVRTLTGVELTKMGMKPNVRPDSPEYPTKSDCFEPKSGKYWSKRDGRWISHSTEQYNAHLFYTGYAAGPGGAVTLDCEISEIKNEVTKRAVTLYPRLSGYSSGVHELPGGQMSLVLESPKFIDPQPGYPETILGFLGQMFGYEHDGGEQYNRAIDWMSDALQKRLGTVRGQNRVFLVAGPAQCGKGVLVKELLSPLLGGRTRLANASKYILGQTEFNGEWAEADMLLIDDAVGDGKMSTKIETADRIKSIVAGDDYQYIHRKGLPGMQLPVWWRLIMLMNDTEEVLATLPPMIDGFADKFLIMQAHRTVLNGAGSQSDYIARMRSELPQFAQFLLDWKIPVERLDGRGPASWSHPTLMDSLLSTGPEAELMELLQTAKEFGVGYDREKLSCGTREKIHECMQYLGNRYTNLCRSSRQLGTYLRRLEQRGSVSYTKTNGVRNFHW